jgi:hypothetical protein
MLFFLLDCICLVTKETTYLEGEGEGGKLDKPKKSKHAYFCE